MGPHTFCPRKWQFELLLHFSSSPSSSSSSCVFVLACTGQRLTRAHLLLSWSSLTQGFTGDISCRDFYSCAHGAESKRCSNHHSQEQSSANLPTLLCSPVGEGKGVRGNVYLLSLWCCRRRGLWCCRRRGLRCCRHSSSVLQVGSPRVWC